MVGLEEHGVAVDPDLHPSRHGIQDRAAHPVADDPPVLAHLVELSVQERLVGARPQVATPAMGDDPEPGGLALLGDPFVVELVPVQAHRDAHVALGGPDLVEGPRVGAEHLQALPPVDGADDGAGPRRAAASQRSAGA